MGGIFGRVDAVFGAIECQKSGTLHAHFQIFVQCFHQFHPLTDLHRLSKILEDVEWMGFVEKYKSYASHTSRKVYADPNGWESRARAEVENQWPEFRDSLLMLSRPGYQYNEDIEAHDWKQTYLDQDVERLQQHKQHHVHLPDEEGRRQPLAHCRDAKNPSKCKGGFPHDKWQSEETLLICSGLAEQMDMPHKGKRSMLGLFYGPCNDPNLNGTHPGLLAALRCNSDVQVPYRFPITAGLHAPQCTEECDKKVPIYTLIKEAQITQAAQAGYQCDYQNKRLPLCIHECKEWEKGQRKLAEELEKNKTGYYAARANKRLITDCYARGVCRGAAEAANLTTYSFEKKNEPTGAESIKTAPLAEIALQYPLHLIQQVSSKQPWPKEPARQHIDHRAYTNKKTQLPFWTGYGARGCNAAVHMLSPFEFARHFHFKMASHPMTLQSHAAHERDPEKYHASLTQAGVNKLKEGGRCLEPGLHYTICEEGCLNKWLPMGNGLHAQAYRHDWIIVPRNRPNVPTVYNAQGSRTEEDQALRLLVLFFPWVNDPKAASPAVPFIGDLRPPRASSWRQALRLRLFSGFPTEEVKRYAIQFCQASCIYFSDHVLLLEPVQINSMFKWKHRHLCGGLFPATAPATNREPHGEQRQ